ncbi:hypothetical protein JRO89_XS02G0101300 [Xanthoceras sorbifolium]|uniref:Uncharacterized protein n=1 Tax=Xanthoceras sorbifolium TaxID=99658 RepID=A0ABQ8IG32_9ROSI|nr:hypothetical protein JRO89_XS02G0101300 [Xanthoceras sorbifolium]
MGHTWRKQMSQFDGTKKTKPAPERPTGEDVVKELEELRPITHERNYDGGQSSTDTSQLSIFSIPGKPFGKAGVKELSIQQHEVATFYVLQNCDESQPFIQEHKNMLLDADITNVEEIHKLEFVNWFNQRVFYTRGLKDITWSAVTEIKPRNLYEMPVNGGPY